MDGLLPPLPPGGILDNSFNFSAPSQSSGNGLPPLPDLSTLPTLNGVTNAVVSTVNPSSTPSSTTVSKDGIIAKVAYLVLGVVIIAGAIWVYRK